MKIAIQGLWHLGCVTAACIAKYGHNVVGITETEEESASLNSGKLPIYEPGLETLIKQNLAIGNLKFTSNSQSALMDADVLWITYDTPVNDSDEADVNYVISRIEKNIPFLSKNAVVLISSQLPVGSCESIKIKNNCHIAYVPENLRLGKAIDVFLNPDRVIAGSDEEKTSKVIQDIFSPITKNIEWMSCKSAEMTKHAVNAFLACSVVFINEIASICEMVGADASEVSRGLKSEQRIGPGAYLGAGNAFAGGTLARDINFLSTLTNNNLFKAILKSNRKHSSWPLKSLKNIFPLGLIGIKVCLLGLAYKPKTDTLRRSSAIELAKSLNQEGCIISASDALIKHLPEYPFINISDLKKIH